MMSQVIQKEAVVFLLAAGHGAMLALFYDFFRALRRVVPHSIGAVSAEDFLFWMTAGFLTFCLLFLETEGEIRGYVAAGIGLGTLLYLQTVSASVRIAMTAVFGFVGKLFRLIKKVLWFPVRKLAGLAVMAGRKLCRLVSVGWRHINRNKKRGETAGKTKKRIEFPVKKVYNKKKRAEKRRKKTGVHMHRQYERGSMDESEGQKKARKQKQPQGNAGHRRRSSLFAGGGACSESEADSEEQCISGAESRTRAADQG